jgi:oligosaccharide repeat unit polymerase
MIFIPIGVIIALSLFVRILQRSWFAPGPFFGLIWIVYTLAPIIIIPEYPVYSIGLWVIVMFVFSIQVGSLIGTGFGILKRKDYNNSKIIEKQVLYKCIEQRLLIFTLLFTFISFAGVIFLIKFGITLYDIEISKDSILRLGHFFSVARYIENYELPFQIRILILGVYTAALSGGFLFALTKKRIIKILSLLPIIIIIMNGIIIAARAGIYLSIFLWLSGFLSIKILLYQGNYKLDIKKIFCIMILITFMLIVYILLQWVRGGVEKKFYNSALLSHGMISILGYLSAFTNWFKNADLSTITLGEYTFAGLFDLLGISERELGVYPEPSYFTGTNIYTVFRGLIQDFTLPGALLLSFLVGFISGLAYRKCCQRYILWTFFLSLFYSFTLWSHVVSLFTYNSLILAWFIIIFLFIFPKIVIRR